MDEVSNTYGHSYYYDEELISLLPRVVNVQITQDEYIDAISALANRVSDEVTIYDIVVPISSGIYLDEKLQEEMSKAGQKFMKDYPLEKGYEKFIDDTLIHTYNDDWCYSTLLWLNGYKFTPCSSYSMQNGSIDSNGTKLKKYNDIEPMGKNHVYIDGTKLEANANKYTWVWKKACMTSRDRVYMYLTQLIQEINDTDLFFHNFKIGIRKEYTIEYVEFVIEQYQKIMEVDTSAFVYGSGKRKTALQKHYEKLTDYLKKLKKYAHHIKVCGDDRNSYSKTDTDATFMRIKKDYMGNDQLLPAYNVQLGICDEYIAVMDMKQYASDMECFVPLMEKFNNTYGFYPRYPVADAGYGSYNNYLYCEQKGMEKYMKFTMFKKECEDKKYSENPYRAVNFNINENGNLICPNNKEFHYLYSSHVKGNKYGRTEEYYQCEDCSNCSHKENCSKAEGNRTIRLNQELTGYHQEVLNNLNSTKGALLRMNRSIQAEGAFGTIKWNRYYKRARRKGLKGVIFELSLKFSFLLQGQ